MSYQVLARKWRPKIFREMVGQEHVLQALINALDHNRLHHAYLFTGTRGVGKTTIARILAKCLNCEIGVSSEPCGECSACNEIAEGRFVDLIEVDAASRTKVEDTRELLDNVQYAPTRGRYKIYLIDEVHMLSNHSFNALLKTLEEPPEHVKFLLATTDPQKLPVTILSRCLQFNLKNMSSERIVGHLQHVLSQELIPFDDASLWLLARAADGSMRDALSLTDQAISFGNGKLAEDDIVSMLGSIDQRLIHEIVAALIASDAAKILEAVKNFAEHAPDYSAALADLLAVLHRVAIAQALPSAVDNSFGDKTLIVSYASQLPSEDVQLFYQTALMGRRDLPLSSDSRSGFEMTLLRMLAFKPQGVADVPQQALSNNSSTAGSISEKVPQTPTHQPSQTLPEPLLPESPVTDNSVSTEANTENRHVDTAPWEHANNTGSHDSQVNTVELKKVEPSLIESSQVKPREVESSLSETNSVSINNIEEHSSKKLLSPNRAQELSTDTQNIKEQLRQQVKSIEAQSFDTNTPVNKKSADIRTIAIEKVALKDLTPNNWVQVFRGLALKGIVSSTASNCVLTKVEGLDDKAHLRDYNESDGVNNSCRLTFILDENKGSLFDSSQSERLAVVLSEYFSRPIKTIIHPETIPVGAETPAAIAAREYQERYEQALASLKADPVVQTLEKQFGARLDEQSIKIH